MSTDDLAQRLLDAHVRHEVERLTGELLAEDVSDLVHSLFDTVGDQQVADLVDTRVVHEVVERLLVSVPGSAAVAGLVEMVRDVVREGPDERFALGDVVERGQVEALVDALLGLTPVLERVLTRLQDSPMVGAMASRFMARIVGEVMQTNQAIADKVPGLGSLLSFGTAAAKQVAGAAGSPFEALVGDAVGKGSTFAVGRMNHILLETLRDPTTRDAVLQAWDLAAAEPVRGAGDDAAAEEAAEQWGAVVHAGHDVVVTVLGDERTVAFGRAILEAFVERFGGYTPVELLDELDLDRADVVDDVVRLAPAFLAPLLESGDLERLVRDRLEPFYRSAAFAEAARG
ncbi:hypothetical protein ABFT23_01490 [Nocardioides sp. C4-1]|uniref:hypothetical protein n=1 Tax=Nocardioides sp. C4-1 TaxID=3151851 RepID=UPI003265E846